MQSEDEIQIDYTTWWYWETFTHVHLLELNPVTIVESSLTGLFFFTDMYWGGRKYTQLQNYRTFSFFSKNASLSVFLLYLPSRKHYFDLVNAIKHKTKFSISMCSWYQNQDNQTKTQNLMRDQRLKFGSQNMGCDNFDAKFMTK